MFILSLIGSNSVIVINISVNINVYAQIMDLLATMVVNQLINWLEYNAICLSKIM